MKITIKEPKDPALFSYLKELGFEVKKEKKYKTNKHVFIEKSYV